MSTAKAITAHAHVHSFLTRALNHTQILIGLLGPTTASVANLLTIGVVAIIDLFFLGRSIPLMTLTGAAMVGSGFGMILWAGEA